MSFGIEGCREHHEIWHLGCKLVVEAWASKKDPKPICMLVASWEKYYLNYICIV